MTSYPGGADMPSRVQTYMLRTHDLQVGYLSAQAMWDAVKDARPKFVLQVKGLDTAQHPTTVYVTARELHDAVQDRYQRRERVEE
jgi:hypothetical protein